MVRDRLGPRQALLAYHVFSDSLDENRVDGAKPTGSWVFSVTRESVQAFPVPERYELEQRIAVYRGIFAARDGSEEVPSARLYEDLLADAIDVLPAEVDRARPDRSAVVLAPGASDEDGLLHMSEIAELDLDGQLVILSGCRSASGELVDGEGMVGLSLAFFQAGARTVVGSLWPLRDEETADLVGDFSRGLGSGLGVAAALAEARRRRISSGAPAAAWAGLVVLGDGDLVLTERRRWSPVRLLTSLTVLAVLVLGFWLLRRSA